MLPALDAHSAYVATANASAAGAAPASTDVPAAVNGTPSAAAAAAAAASARGYSGAAVSLATSVASDHGTNDDAGNAPPPDLSSYYTSC